MSKKRDLDPAPRQDRSPKPARSKPRARGPRPANTDTRGAILAAARTRFAARGYDGTRLRDVAADADVDVALVSYFFGSKDGLFAAAMALTVNPAEMVEELMQHGTDLLGERLARMFLRLWDDPLSGSPLLALVRSAASHEPASSMLRGFVERELLGRLATAIDAPDPELRAALVGSQLIGVAMARHVVRVQPITGSDAETLVAAIGPTLQRYLTGRIEIPDRPDTR